MNLYQPFSNQWLTTLKPVTNPNQTYKKILYKPDIKHVQTMFKLMANPPQTSD